MFGHRTEEFSQKKDDGFCTKLHPKVVTKMILKMSVWTSTGEVRRTVITFTFGTTENKPTTVMAVLVNNLEMFQSDISMN